MCFLKKIKIIIFTVLKKKLTLLNQPKFDEHVVAMAFSQIRHFLEVVPKEDDTMSLYYYFFSDLLLLLFNVSYNKNIVIVLNFTIEIV